MIVVGGHGRGIAILVEPRALQLQVMRELLALVPHRGVLGIISRHVVDYVFSEVLSLLLRCQHAALLREGVLARLELAAELPA